MLCYTALRIDFSNADPSSLTRNPPAILGVFQTCAEARAAIEKQMLDFELDFKMASTSFTMDLDHQELKTDACTFKWWWRECELKGHLAMASVSWMGGAR